MCDVLDDFLDLFESTVRTVEPVLGSTVEVADMVHSSLLYLRLLHIGV